MAKRKQSQTDNKQYQSKEQPKQLKAAPSPRGRDGEEIDGDVADEM